MTAAELRHSEEPPRGCPSQEAGAARAWIPIGSRSDSKSDGQSSKSKASASQLADWWTVWFTSVRKSGIAC